MKILKKQFLAVGGLVMMGLLSACGEAPSNDKLISSEVHQVQVLSINPPKRYYVKFLDLNNGIVVNKHIAKRCSSYRRISVNQVYDLTVEIRENSKGEQRVTYPDARKVFCPK